MNKVILFASGTVITLGALVASSGLAFAANDNAPRMGNSNGNGYTQQLQVKADVLKLNVADLREQLAAGTLPMLLPEGVVHVLDGVEAEAVDAEPLRPGDLGIEEVLRDLGVLGPEVGEAGYARRDVVRTAVPLLVRPEPPLRLRVLRVLRLVASVVVDDV